MGPDRHAFSSLLGQALGQPAERDEIMTHDQWLSLCPWRNPCRLILLVFVIGILMEQRLSGYHYLSRSSRWGPGRWDPKTFTVRASARAESPAR